MNWLPLIQGIGKSYGFWAAIVVVVLIAALYLLGIDVREWVM
jgi:hypothetical protein